MAGQPSGKARARLRAGLVSGHQITELPEPTPLIEDLIDLNSVSVLFGPSGGGKSLIALDWALHVASGMSWWGRPTVPGRVLYVVAEGAHGTKHRYEAWCEYHDIERVDDIVWMTVPANVLRDDEREELLAIVAELSPCLTVLDTLARHMPGGDENSFETMSQIVETLDSIKRETGGAAVGVHHAGKDEEKGSRGHSSLKGALDGELSLRTQRVEKQMICSVYAEKFKDREDHRVLYTAKMEPVGRSLVPVVEGELGLKPVDRDLLMFLNGQYTHYSDWLRASGLAKSTFSRSHKRLVTLGFVEGDATLGWKRANI